MDDFGGGSDALGEELSLEEVVGGVGLMIVGF